MKRIKPLVNNEPQLDSVSTRKFFEMPLIKLEKQIKIVSKLFRALLITLFLVFLGIVFLLIVWFLTDTFGEDAAIALALSVAFLFLYRIVYDSI